MNKIRIKTSTKFQQIFEQIFVEILVYLDPWNSRKCCSINKQWNTKIFEIMNLLDSFFQKYKKKCYLYCHDRMHMKFPYDYSLIAEHECNIVHPQNSLCYRNNDFGVVHWDITTSNFKPLKCIECGKIFLTRKIVRKYFFLNSNDISNVTRYISYYDSRVDLFDKHEIQWLALMKYGTISPMYYPTKGRVHRETIMLQMFTNVVFPSPFTQESVFASLPFRLYSEGKFKAKPIVLLDRYLAMIDRFVEFNNEWKQSEIFTAMENMTIISHGYNESLKKSLNWFLGESIYYNNIEYGLKQARQFILRVFRSRSNHDLFALNSLPILSQQKTVHAIEAFTNGYLDLQNLIEIVNIVQQMCERKRLVISFLHEKGIYCEYLKCNSMDVYVNNNSVSKSLVYECMKNHVVGKKECMV